MASDVRRRVLTSKDTEDTDENRQNSDGNSDEDFAVTRTNKCIGLVLSSDDECYSDASSTSFVDPISRKSHLIVDDRDVVQNRQEKECVKIVNDEAPRIEQSNSNEGISCAFFENRQCEVLPTQPVDDNERTIINGCVAPDLNFREVPETAASKRKVLEIEEVLSKTSVNVQKLRKLAISEGGLINDNIRKRAWHILLGIDHIPPLQPLTEKELEANGEYSQVVLDVNRSLKRFPPGIPYDQRVVLQDQLTRLIMRVIIKHPRLRYYQGYHDVAVTVLLVVGEEIAFPIMEKLSTGHLNECMAETMEQTSYLLNYIYPLLKRLHPKLYDYMERSGCGTLFCLPWYLTWYGHNLNHYTDVVRLYDYFMSTDKLLPLYLAVAIVVYRRDEIFGVECDMPYIHSLLSNIPDDLPFEKLLLEGTELYKKYPPSSIEKEVYERVRQAQLELTPPKDQRIRRQAPLRNILRMAPRVGRYSLFLATATLVVGLYAYIRTASAIDVDTMFSIR